MGRKNKSVKEISIEQLRLGMFLCGLRGSWMNHPFWNTRFKIEDPDDLTALRASGITHVWIDTSRGLDVAPEHTAHAGGATDNQQFRGEAELQALVHDQTHGDKGTDLASELVRAAAICARSRQAVTTMFSDVRMGGAIDIERLDALVQEIADSIQRNPCALISLARLKNQDEYTYMHSVAVCGLMISLSRQIGLEEAMIRECGLAGMVHDVGKALVSPEILNKPGKLTDEEFIHIKSHPVSGHALLLEADNTGPIPLDVCLHHHEKIDGSGYPDRLDDGSLSMFARMGAVCDVYDAITSDRPYKAGWDPATAMRKMHEWCNRHLDKKVFQAFVKTIGIYPVGSLVKLESGLLAVVTDASPSNLLTPKVKTFYCTRRRSPMYVKTLDLAQPGISDRIVGCENPEDWNFPDLNELWAGDSAARHQRRGLA
ncbi:MAG: HD-GYP domain-containing protein [Dehalococcoidia bacterium]